jgi:type IV secretory pathway VirJ component
MCLFISGDGGWYSLEQELADCMAQLGIPTLGLDAKLYFWNRRTPQETAKDMAHLIREYEDLWHRNRIVFIGYSLGADVLPFIIENLPKDIQQKIQGTLLLSPDPNADFEIHLTDMVGLGNADDKYNVVDAIKRIGQYGHVVIVTGSEEHSALSQDLLGTPVVFDTVAGDHHYNHKVQAIYTIIKKLGF